MARVSSAQLFGGALLAAGLSTQSVEASSTFNLVDVSGYDTFANVFAYDLNTFNAQSSYSYGPTPINLMATADSVSATATIAPEVIGATAQTVRPMGSYAPAYAYAFVRSGFTLDMDTDVNVFWGFEPSNSFDIFIYEILPDSSVATIFQENGDNSAGDVVVSLLAGRTYVAIGTFVGPDDDNLIGFSIAPIPTPATTVLLALGGIVATRRRR